MGKRKFEVASILEAIPCAQIQDVVPRKVERPPDGQVTETILGGHNQNCFQYTKQGNGDSTETLSGNSIHNSFASYNSKASQFQNSSSNKTKRVQQEVTRLGTSTETGKDEDEPDPKRRRRAQIQKFGEPETVPSDKSITDGRVIAQTTSEVDGASYDTSDAFEPQSTSVTLSASKYHDVVIRYGRGDMSNGDFISHLRAALCRRGISVYENFDEADSVPECSVLIILFTSTYVPSNLLNILEHQQTGNLVVYPIFYRLSPNDLISNIKNY